jgi:cell division protein FtsI (penicillin-binding protein 3)
MAASLQMLNVPPDDKTVSSLAGSSVITTMEAENAG